MGLRTRTKIAIKTALFGGAVSYAERLIAEAEADLEVLRRDVVQARARRETTMTIIRSGLQAWVDGFASSRRAPGRPRPAGPENMN